jgi:hypothetical protein
VDDVRCWLADMATVFGTRRRSYKIAFHVGSKKATRKAADFLQANCPVDQTRTPPGRVAAMEKRLNAMMEAIKIVQPALQSFYGSLTDEQKARFNQLGAAQG